MLNSKRWEKMEARGVKEECEIFRKAVLAFVREVRGMQKVGEGQVRKGSQWWDNKIKLPMKERCWGSTNSERVRVIWRHKWQDVKRKVYGLKKSRQVKGGVSKY